MKKIVFALALSLTLSGVFAQEEAVKDSVTDGWKRGGNVAINI